MSTKGQAMTTTEHTEACERDRLALAVEFYSQENGNIDDWPQDDYDAAMVEIKRDWLPADDLYSCDCAEDAAWRREWAARLFNRDPIGP